MRKLGIFLLFVFVFILVAGISYFVLFNLAPQGSGDIRRGIDGGDDSLLDSDESDEEGTGVNAGVSGRAIAGGSGGGAGGAQSGGAGSGAGAEDGVGSGLDSGCIKQQISYALKNFIKTEICNEFDGGICFSKTVGCSLEVHNFDESVSGVFSVRFTFFDNSAGFDSIVVEKNVNSRDFEIFNGVLELQSEGGDGRANQEIDCSFNTEKIPKKEVC